MRDDTSDNGPTTFPADADARLARLARRADRRAGALALRAEG